jgi:hypothetical protein
MSEQSRFLGMIADNTMAVLLGARQHAAEWSDQVQELTRRARAANDVGMVALLEAIAALLAGEPTAEIHPHLDGVFAACWSRVTQGVAEGGDPVRQAVFALLNARTGEEFARILEAHHRHLLSEVADDVLDELIEQYRNDPERAAHLEQCRSFLRDCIRQAVVEAELTAKGPDSGPGQGGLRVGVTILFNAATKDEVEAVICERLRQLDGEGFFSEPLRDLLQAYSAEEFDQLLRALRATRLAATSDECEQKIGAWLAEYPEVVPVVMQLGGAGRDDVAQGMKAARTAADRKTVRVIQLLLDAETAEKGREIILAYQERLLCESIDRIFVRLLEAQRGRPDLVRLLRGHHAVLQRCRQEGVHAVFRTAETERLVEEHEPELDLDILAQNTLSVLLTSPVPRGDWLESVQRHLTRARHSGNTAAAALLVTVVGLLGGRQQGPAPDLYEPYRWCWERIATGLRTGQDPVADALSRLLNARGLAARRAVIEQSMGFLLTRAASLILIGLCEQHRDDPDMLAHLRGVQILLRRCAKRGVVEALAVEARREELIDQFNRPELGRGTARREYLCQAILEVLDPEAEPAFCAAIHNEIGLCLCTVPGEDRASRLERAIEHYRAALQFDAPREAWAETHSNLGGCLRRACPGRTGGKHRDGHPSLHGRAGGADPRRRHRGVGRYPLQLGNGIPPAGAGRPGCEPRDGHRMLHHCGRGTESEAGPASVGPAHAQPRLGLHQSPGR